MIDLEKLLTPISEESPTGVSLRDQPADLTFQQLEEERTEVGPEDDPTGAGHVPNWEKVAVRCEEALFTPSKDLQQRARIPAACAGGHRAQTSMGTQRT